MTAWVVAGRAGTGKSTLGLALARATGSVLLDLDTLTNPLLDLLHGDSPGHWNDDDRRSVVRPARYAALRAVAASQVLLGLDVVLVAPFTAELAGGPEWQQLCAALAPATPTVVWLHAPDDVLAARVRGRAEPRDARERAVVAVVPPRVPHLAVDATLPTEKQVSLVLGMGTGSG
jgi:sugar-phosphatase